MCTCILSYSEKKKTPYDRARLDRRRLQEAYIKYSILTVGKRYREHFPDLTIHPSLEQTLEEISPVYYKVFSRIYMGMLCTHTYTSSVAYTTNILVMKQQAHIVAEAMQVLNDRGVAVVIYKCC